MGRRFLSAQLSCDPVYRAIVSDCLKAGSPPELLGVVSDYREDKGLPRLACKAGCLAKKEARRPSSWYPPLTPEDEKAKAREDERKALACKIGDLYHQHIGRLFQSKWGEVLYGKGGQETRDRDRYSKKWHNSYGSAKNLNGGARIAGEGRKAQIILENHRGTQVAILPWPPKGLDSAGIVAWLKGL